jgi:hypothetical protein
MAREAGVAGVDAETRTLDEGESLRADVMAEEVLAGAFMAMAMGRLDWDRVARVCLGF